MAAIEADIPREGGGARHRDRLPMPEAALESPPLRRRPLAPLLAAICLCWAMLAQATPLILVVEGVNPYRLLLPVLGAAAVSAAAWEEGYLMRSPLTAAIARQTGGEVRRIAWSGVPTDQAGLRAAIDLLKAELAAAQGQGRVVWLLSHSLGSVIAYLALADGGGRTPVQTFVSLASPFGRPPIMQWLAQAHPGLPLAPLRAGVQGPAGLGVGRWINVYTAWDPLGGPIRVEGVENHALELLPSGPLPSPTDLILAHTLPFRDAGVADLVIAAKVGAPPPTGP